MNCSKTDWTVTGKLTKYIPKTNQATELYLYKSRDLTKIAIGILNIVENRIKTSTVLQMLLFKPQFSVSVVHFPSFFPKAN